ncbi:LysR family transcriptional regulator [Microcella daejeonensis]|uniref:LysR family transcriptional regulator n=1 Tax=Microcella daejeonensis TaxID=2994971 RepID=A0A9E8S993_9MICO|nr:LysR family transcriptional regulator [Microcella daejeonensis]WAB81754.1 LysR family transcriptional regulator [Microcella daejeonensis]
MDLDLRKLRYFVALARHQHFGRAAGELHIAQPVLSRQIRALEDDLGCALLLRTTRSVHLTPAGEQLAADALSLFSLADATVRRALQLDRGAQRIILAFAPGLQVSDAVRAHEARHPSIELELLRVDWWEQDAPLRDGRADAGFLRRPFDDGGLDVASIGAERKVACLPLTHPLARRESLVVADLLAEPVLDTHARRTSSVEEKFELIASGHGIAMVPRSVARLYSRPDLVYRAVTDATLVETCLAIAADRREPEVRQFFALAATVLRRQARARVAEELV